MAIVGTTVLPNCITPQIIKSAACLCGTGGTQTDKIEVILLCQIVKTLSPSMSCDAKTLIQQAACVCGVTGTPLQFVKLQLLCNILTALGGSGGGAGGGLISCGTGIPTGTPVTSCAIYIRKEGAMTALYAWDGTQWQAIVGT